MRKEYGDLSPSQKLNYIKSNAVITVCMITPLILGGIVIIMLADSLEMYDESDNMNYTNNGTHMVLASPIQESTELEEVTDNNIEIITSIILFLVLGGMFGTMYIGGLLGDYITMKCNWYTDFDLERTKKKLAKIEEALK